MAITPNETTIAKTVTTSTQPLLAQEKALETANSSMSTANGNSALGTTGTVLILNGGTLQLPAGNTLRLANTFTIGAGGSSINDGQNLTLDVFGRFKDPKKRASAIAKLHLCQHVTTPVQPQPSLAQEEASKTEPLRSLLSGFRELAKQAVAFAEPHLPSTVTTSTQYSKK